MKPLPAAPSAGHDTRVWHGGNEYGGPGAWKRPPRSKKRSRSEVATNGPLDLTAFFGEKWLFARASMDAKHHNKGDNNTTHRSHAEKAGAPQMRLESLSLAMAPSHGAGASVPVGGEDSSSTQTTKEPKRSHPPASSSYTNSTSDNVFPLPTVHQSGVGPLLREVPLPQSVRLGEEVREETSSEMASPPRILNHLPQQQQQQQQQQQKHSASTAVVVRGSFERCHASIDAPPPPASSQLPKQEAVAQIPQQQEPNLAWNAMRVPSATIKMAVDDRYNAELLQVRAMLRALLSKQKQLGEAMRQCRLEACLGTPGVLRARKQGRKQMGHIGRRGRHNKNQSKKIGAGGGGGGGVRTRGPTHSHPLLFMAEGDVQKNERAHMRLEDAEAMHLLKLKEARRRKQDYAMYYEFALRYGPLAAREFELAVLPGRRYYAKISDASRALQNWWWSVWPSTLRRRKAGALVIQSLFRGFVQRRRWYAIIRLRTLWGNTRIAAHAFLQWRDMVLKSRRAKAFARRLRYRCEAQCFAMLVAHARQKHQSREEILRRHLQKVSDGVRLRVFEGWVSYTETSLTVERMRWRSATRPAFRMWGGHALEKRRQHRQCSASAMIIHRVLGWRRRARYVDLRRVCINMQAIARRKLARIQRKKKVIESLMCQAEEAVQSLEDWRVRHLMDAEQQRRRRLQTAIDRDASLAQQAASAFLRTPDGKSAVASRLRARKKKEEEEETKNFAEGPGEDTLTKSAKRGHTAVAHTAPDVEARKEVARMFVRRRQALTKHDFNATSPPPLRCPRFGCDATFVNPAHYVRHAADVHPKDGPEIAELALLMQIPVGLALLESWIGTATATGGESDAHADREGAEKVLLTSEKCETAENALLVLWKAIEDWRTATSSSDDYQRLGRYVLNNTFALSSMMSTTNTKGSGHLSGEVAGSEPVVFYVGSSSLGITTHKNASGITHGHPTTEYSPSEDAINPLAFEEISWRALVSLNAVAGRAFLTSTPYARYLDEVERPRREAIEAKAADIAKRKRSESLAEAQKLREEAFLRVQEEMIDELAEKALTIVLQGTGTAAASSFLGDLVEDQATLLSVVIIAERSVFTKIISAVWNEAVDEAAAAESAARRENREISPAIADTLSEAASAVVRSRVMDQLIDDCILDLTGPQGELWADARAMAAVADGVGYRVRCDVIEDMLKASIVELQESGEAEQLMSDAERRREEEAEAAGNAANASEASAAATEEEDLSEATGEAVVAATHLVALGVAEAAQQENPSVDAQEETDTTADAAATDDNVFSPSITGGARGALGLDEKDVFTTGDDEMGEIGWTNGARNCDALAARLSISKQGAADAEQSVSMPSPEDAAVVVQSAWRRQMVYRGMRTLVAQNFVKLYDPAYGAFYWYSQATGESTWEKPAIIDAYFKTNA